MIYPTTISVMKLKAYSLLLDAETDEMKTLLNEAATSSDKHTNPKRLIDYTNIYIAQLTNQKESLQIAANLVRDAKEESNTPFRKVEL